MRNGSTADPAYLIEQRDGARVLKWGSDWTGIGVTEMPAKSKAQQQAAGAALSAKRGDSKVKDLKGASKDMYDSMSEDELEDFAETKRKGLPDKK